MLPGHDPGSDWGDEFAVVFWEKDGPRQRRIESAWSVAAPQAVELIFARFKKLLATHELQRLGPSGGLLTISAYWRYIRGRRARWMN